MFLGPSIFPKHNKSFLNTFPIHVRSQYSVDPGHPPPPLSYTSSEPISNIFTFLEYLTNDYIWSAVFFCFSEMKDPFLCKKAKRTEIWDGSTLYARLFLTDIQKRYDAGEYGAFFRF